MICLKSKAYVNKANPPATFLGWKVRLEQVADRQSRQMRQTICSPVSSIHGGFVPIPDETAHPMPHQAKADFVTRPVASTYHFSLVMGLPASRAAIQSATTMAGLGPIVADDTPPTEWRES